MFIKVLKSAKVKRITNTYGNKFRTLKFVFYLRQNFYSSSKFNYATKPTKWPLAFHRGTHEKVFLGIWSTFEGTVFTVCPCPWNRLGARPCIIPQGKNKNNFSFLFYDWKLIEQNMDNVLLNEIIKKQNHKSIKSGRDCY